MKSFIYLGSKSQSRQRLLKEAQISFVQVECSAKESKCDWGLTLQESVERIALYKMEHVILPERKEGSTCFVLTADSLTLNPDGSLSGKPVDRADAIAKIKASRGLATGGTAFCLDKRIYKSGKWEVFKRIQGYGDAKFEWNVPDEWIDIYLEKSIGMGTAGAIAIELYGEQFLKYVNGSYSAIIGLPMFQLRQALQELGFFDSILKR
jgi:septum formation protein